MFWLLVFNTLKQFFCLKQILFQIWASKDKNIWQEKVTFILFYFIVCKILKYSKTFNKYLDLIFSF